MPTLSKLSLKLFVQKWYNLDLLRGFNSYKIRNFPCHAHLIHELFTLSSELIHYESVLTNSKISLRPSEVGTMPRTQLALPLLNGHRNALKKGKKWITFLLRLPLSFFQ